MKLYNTLTRRKEEFVPIVDKKVGIYVCGSTTYNFIHIGNARPCVVFDSLRRYLEYKGFTVDFVQNFTDIDDKIIDKANAENVTAEQISDRYIKEFFVDIDGLHVKKATHYPRVTEEMNGIISMIGTLIEKGFAYEKNGTVYFDAPKVEDYGKLSKKNIEDLEAGARVELNSEKLSTSDFVLWKPAKAGEPKWASPWSEGRPGWHIECSVMAKKYLGETIDIHCGGEDLIFPHHENEIAQSEAANGKPFANYWLHNGMINIDHQKMSKSKGNFFTVRDITAKFAYDVLRFYILSVQYRSPLNFSDELLQASQNGLDRIKNCKRTMDEWTESAAAGEMSCAETESLKEAESFIKDFESAMEDDVNTANAVTVVFELVKFINTNASAKNSAALIKKLSAELCFLCDILGIDLNAPEGGSGNEDTSEIDSLIAQRQSARASKNWAEADRIRGLLNEKGIVIKDTPEGVKWFYS